MDFEKPGMLHVFGKILPGYKPPCRQTVGKHMRVKYQDYRKILKEILLSVQHVALTTDMWKNRNRRYFICITIHFFDPQLQLVSLRLSFRRFYGRKLSDRLKTYINNEIQKNGIKDKVKAIVCGKNILF